MSFLVNIPISFVKYLLSIILHTIINLLKHLSCEDQKLLMAFFSHDESQQQNKDNLLPNSEPEDHFSLPFLLFSAALNPPNFWAE